MKKKFTILITAAFMLLTMMATTGRMWGQEATLSFTSNSWGLPEGSNAGIQGPASYISGNDTITLYASTKFYYNTSDKYLLFGKTNSTLTLPKFSFDVEKIEVVGRNGASGSVKQNIYVGNNAVSTETTGATGTNTYMISSNYQTAGNVYVLKVTSNHNTQVTSIKIYKKQETSVATPTFSPEGGTYTEAQTVTISCDTQNVDIYYTTDGSTPDDESTQYNGSITVSESMTIKAIAYDSDDNASSVATAVYTIQQPLSTMDEIFAAATAAGNTATTVIINFDNWVVTGVKNKNAYVTDGTKGFIIYQDGHGFSVGDVLSGTATCKVQLYNGSSEITTLTATTTGLTVTSGGAVTPATNISIADLTGVNTGAVLSYDNLTYNGTALVDANDNTITPYNTLYSYTFVNGKSYNVKGIYLQYNSTKELLPRSADDIEVVDTEVADPVFSPAAGTYADTQTVTMSCTTEGAAIHYTTDGTEPDGNSTQYSEPISVTAATTFKAKAIKGDDASAVITATYHICSAENPYTVAQALAFHEYPTSIIWVHGIVSTAPTAAPNNGQLTYYISDNGEATNQLQVYKGKGLNNAAFTTQDDIQVGDIVTITGIVKIYNTTTEFDAGNYLTSFERPAVPSISADDVALTYDATSGVIEYEISNFVDGEMSATTEATWISDFTYDPADEFGEVGFTATVNDGAARQATVTLTYTYNTNEIVTKDVTVSQAAAPVPSISVDPAIVNAPATETDGTITVTLTAIYNNEIEVQWFESDGTTAATYNWIEAVVDPNNDIAYLIEENTGDARSAYFKVYGIDGEANDVYSELVTINQEAYVAPTYAELPFAFNGGKADIENTDGLSQEGLGSDYNPTSNPTTKLKFDGTGDWLLLQFDERPGTLTFDIKGNSFSGGTFKVQTSTDGTTFTNLETYDALGDTQSEEFNNLAEDVRYIKWIYTTKDAGNVGLGNIALAEYVVPVASITVTPDLIEAPATPVAPATAITGSLTVTLSNITITELDQLGVDFCDENGTLLTGANAKPSWFESEFELVNEEYKLNYTIDANTETTERVAYFKVYEINSEVYSNKVTVTQEAYVAPTAAITVNPDLVEAPAAETEDWLAITLDNIVITETGGGQFDMVFCDNQGTPLTNQSDKPAWFEFDFQYENDAWSVYYLIAENTTTEERTAYFKVYGLGDNGTTEAYSNLVTVTQAGATGPVTTGTITFGSAAGSTAINSTSVSGDDSMGNTWTITTVFSGETSFTQNANYSQVGASSKPATSITFTTTLAQATTITNFEAKFGGFSGTAGNINLLVGETNVGTGTLNATADVTVTNTTTATGTTLTVTVTNIAKGVKCYYISYTISASTDPMINAPASIDLASDATEGEIEYSIINPATGVNLEATTTTSWISGITVTDEKVTFTTTANTETTERQGTITLSYQGADDKDVTIIQAAYVPPVVMANYALFSGDLVEGDYIIYYDGKAMNNVVSSGRLQYAEIEPEDNVITTDNAAVIWHIAPNNEGYWTIYSADANAYAASTGVKNKAQMLEDGTDDMAMWTVSEISGTYEFVNKANAAGDVNANLRNNTTYGFACYATSTGGALSLYKYTEQTIATYTLEIAGYGNNTGGYRLIASPVLGVTPTVGNGLLTDTYDLYYFDQNEEQQWRNYEAKPFNLAAGKGYLYASKEATEISFTGVPYSGNGVLALDYNDGSTFAGWNLIGNPFAIAATLNMPFYKMNDNGDGFTAKIEDLTTTIAAMEGVFVQVTEAGQSATFTAQTNKGGQQAIAHTNIVLSGDKGKVLDNAIIRFDGGQQLGKFSFNENNAKVYIPQDGNDYAVVNAESHGEMPVNFKAAENGTYTIDFSMDNVEFNYLHLIDNKTGMDIDLMQTSSYTFEASKTDYASRFRLLFSTNGNENSNENNDFGFFDASGNLLVLGIEGKATLQLIDVTGRILSSETFSGNYSKALNAKAGVYMLRLIQGNDVRTQKIVVK